MEIADEVMGKEQREAAPAARPPSVWKGERAKRSVLKKGEEARRHSAAWRQKDGKREIPYYIQSWQVRGKKRGIRGKGGG